MPAPLAVDREQARMLALSIGVREAARQLGIPQGTMQAWSKRGNWFAATRPAQPLPLSVRPVKKAGATAATTPADALAKHMAEHNHRTRIASATAASAMAEAMAADGDPANAQNLKAVVSAASILHGWDQQRNTGNVNVLVQVLGNKAEPEPIEAEILPE